MDQTPIDSRRGELTVQVFVRPNSLAAPVDEKIRRLQQLASEDSIDTLLVRGWPDEVPLSSDTVDTAVVECYERFAAWADREDTSIEPPFDAQTRHSLLTGESREVLVTPVMCLAIYKNETLTSVHPHADEDGHHTVADAIDALAADQVQPAASNRP